MIIIFPIIFWVLEVILLMNILGDRVGFYTKVRQAIIWSAVIFGLVLVLIIEALSVFKAIAPWPLASAWITFSLIIAGLLLKRGIDRIEKNVVMPPFNFFEKCLVLLTAAIIAITLIVAIVAPPNNYDSMTYHMARVMHWAQNHSVAHYPTGIERQLSFPPMAEYAILNFQVLAGNDYFANMVQWLSMVGSILAITLIAKSLGANREQQILSAFLVASIPMGILQSTSTQNDYVMAFWLSCFIYFVIRSRGEDLSLNVFGAAVALGLAMLTKYQAYFYALPFCIWLIWTLIKREKKYFWKHLLLLIFIVLLINAGHYIRNLQIFHSIEGPTIGTTNQIYSPRNILSNVIKSVVTNFEVPFKPINEFLYETVIKFNNILGVDTDDPRTSGFGPFKVGPYTPNEDWLGNPIHTLLIILSIFFFAYTGDARWNRVLLVYLLSCVAGILCMFVFIKYSEAFRRYILTGTVILSPFIGVTLFKYFSRKIISITIVVLFIVSLPPLLMNITRPIIPPPGAARSKYSIITTPREYFYFAGMPKTYEIYKDIVTRLAQSGRKKLGLIGIDNEYPLWVLAKGRGIQIEHMEVKNESSTVQSNFQPQAVIVFYFDGTLDKRLKRKFLKRTYLGRDDLNYDVYLYEGEYFK